MSRSLLAPLTTTFTPPAECSTYGASGGLSTKETYWQAQSCSKGYPHDNAACWPPALVSTPTANLGGWGFYSPGLICPSGYYSACTGAILANGSPSSLNIGTSFSFQFPLTAGETAIGCCPAGLTCSMESGAVQTCATVITTGQVPNKVGFCPSSASSYYTGQDIQVGIAYVPDAQDNKTTITLSSASLYGPLIQIVFKASDNPTLASPTSIPITSPGQAAITSGVYGSTGGNTGSSSDTGSGGLSTGAKIGIGVGVPLAVLLVAAIAAFILFRRRKARHNRGPVPGSAFQGTVEKPAGEYVQANYPSSQRGNYAPVAPGDPKWRTTHEVPDTQTGVELDAVPEHRPVELPTSNEGSRYAY